MQVIACDLRQLIRVIVRVVQQVLYRFLVLGHQIIVTAFHCQIL